VISIFRILALSALETSCFTFSLEGETKSQHCVRQYYRKNESHSQIWCNHRTGEEISSNLAYAPCEQAIFVCLVLPAKKTVSHFLRKVERCHTIVCAKVILKHVIHNHIGCDQRSGDDKTPDLAYSPCEQAIKKCVYRCGAR